MKKNVIIFFAVFLLSMGLIAAARYKPHVYPTNCVGCEDCISVCPKKGKAIHMVAGKAVINVDACIGCMQCVNICSYGAVR